MKYAVFGLMLLLGTPLMAWLAMKSEKARGWIITLFLFSTIISRDAKINFISMERYRGPDRGFEINLTDLTAWALMAAFLIKWPKRVQWMPFNMPWMILLFVIACISALNAPMPLYAGFALFKWFRTGIVYWCAINCVRVGFPRESLWRALLAMGVYMTFIAIKQKYILHIYRIPGPFDHSNTVPLFINQFLPVLMTWGLCDPKLKGWQATASVIASLGLLVASQSTFSRLGMSISVACFLIAIIVANIRAPSKRVRSATIVAVILVMVGGAIATKSILERIRTAPESSEEARKEFNVAAKQMAKDNLFGVGINNFPYVLTYNSRYSQYISVMEDEDQAGVCHHIYNLTAAEMGTPGLYVFVIIILGFLWAPLWSFLRNPPTFEILIVFSFAIGAIGLHASGFAEWVFRITSVMFLYAICSGFAVGYAQKAFEDASAKTLKKRPASPSTLPPANPSTKQQRLSTDNRAPDSPESAPVDQGSISKLNISGA